MDLKNIFTFLAFLFCLYSNKALSQNDIVNFQQLKAIDDNWTVIIDESEVQDNRISYRNQKWLMYFIHWRELTSKNKNISIEYADSLLHNLWRMNFGPTKNSGECFVNGHKAYFAETTLRSSIRTRFIVWNCEETQRQFIADCNINLMMHTPEKYFKLQCDEITPNFSCHHSENIKKSNLEQKVSYEHLNINFNLPENWRSEEFLVKKDTTKHIPGYYINGVSEKEGSLWNLLTDSEKQIDLAWIERSDQELSNTTLNKFVEIFERDTIVEIQNSLKISSIYSNFNFKNITREKDIIQGEGTFDIIVNIPAYKSTDTTQYVQKFFLWNKQNTTYFMLASIIAYQEVMGLPIDLSPAEELFNKFEYDCVLKVINDNNLKALMNER